MDNKLIYQYTNIETLALILNSGKLLFNSLRKVDDMEEGVINSDIKDCKLNYNSVCYISCWSKSNEENIALWHMYTRDMEKGIRIGLPIDMFDKKFNLNKDIIERKKEAELEKARKETNNKNLQFPMQKRLLNQEEYLVKPDGLSVKYVDKKIVCSYSDRTDIDKVGRFKNKIWAFQNEYRFRLFGTVSCGIEQFFSASDLIKQSNIILEEKKLSMDGNIEYELPDNVLFKLDSDVVKRMEIITSPTISDAQRIILYALVGKYNLNPENVKPSALQIRKKV